MLGHKRSMHSQCWIKSSSSASLSLPLLTAEQDIGGAAMGLGGIVCRVGRNVSSDECQLSATESQRSNLPAVQPQAW